MTATPVTGQRVPRSGGRTTAAHKETSFPTHGSAALRPADRAEVPAPPRLRVAPPAPVAVPRAPFVLLVLVVVIGGVLGILLLNTKINENAFRLDDLNSQQAALDVQEQQLQQDLAQLESAGNLEAAARRLGLVDSGKPAYLRLPDGRLFGVPKPATGWPSVTATGGG
ncbi:MAG TPA: hypothetical protein VFE14_20260 [Micromonosporaceae bacterium]|jgi:hypothetical protein|nr:hypothetical protein [Micromonosporaceae bacterium]